MTHALQFGGVPWLREHLAGMLRELLGALEIEPAQPAPCARRHRSAQARSSACARTAWRWSSIGDEQRGTLDRVQAFMAVLEGYAEHVMDAVGADVLDDLPGAAHRARQAPRATAPGC